MRVPIARRNLFEDKRRAVLGVAGVATAFVLVLTLDGIFAGQTRQLTTYIRTADAQLFLAQRGVTTMHMSSSTIPMEVVERVARLPGVAYADPILYQPDSVSSPTGDGVAYVIGYVPGGRGGPRRIAPGRPPNTGEIVLDRRTADKLGVRVGRDVRVLGRSWRIAGLSQNMSTIVNTIVWVPLADFAAQRSAVGRASYVLVGTTGDVAQAASTIRRETGLSVMDKATFAAHEVRIVKEMATALLQIMTSAALIIGMVVTALVLYAATLSRLREIGVMKALGARTSGLVRLVVEQALWTIGAGLLLAVGCTIAVAVVLTQLTDLVMSVEIVSVVRVAVVGLGLAALAASAPLIKVARIDPAASFRR